MRKLSILKIALIIVGILLIATVLYAIYQVKSIQKDLRPLTEVEKQKVVSIQSVNINLTDSQVIYGNVITSGHETFVQVQVREGHFKKSYLINLNTNSLVRKYNEK